MTLKAAKELKAKEKIENQKKKEELKIQKELEKERLRASKKVFFYYYDP